MKYTLALLFTLSSLLTIYAAPKSGVIKGRVLSIQTMTPIADAYIAIVGGSNASLSGEDGEFQIDEAPLGYVTLQVTALGFKPLTTESFLVSAAQPSTIDLMMEENGVRVGEIVVVRSRYIDSKESPVSAHRLSLEEIEKTPGANRDVSKAVQSLPGVLATSVQRNDLIVRGGGANENRYYLDGIDIPVLNHFAIQGGSGGNASLVNTDFISGVNFFSSAFPAYFSNGVSSVMDLRMKRGNSERFKAKLTVGASDLGVSVDTPISKNKKTTLIASYRRSYLQLLFKTLGLPFLPTYNDAQFKVSTKFDDKNELSFIGLGSFDNNVLNTTIKEPDDYQRYLLGYLPENRQKSYVIGATYKRRTDFGTMSFVVSRNHFSNIFEKYETNDESLPRILDYNSTEIDNRFKAELSRAFGDGYNFTVGLGGSEGSYSGKTKRFITDGGSQVRENYDSNLSLFRYEIFSSISKSLFKERLDITLALRTDANTYSSSMANPLHQISPRLALKYRVSDKIGISGSIGRYFQEPTYTTLGYLNPKGEQVNKQNGLKYIASTHYVAGVEFSLSPLSRLSLEGFYKKYNDYPVSLVDSLPLSTADEAGYTVGDVPVKSIGRGRAYGGELSYSISQFYNTLINVSYTLLYSEFNKLDKDLNVIKNEYVRSSWDIRHILNITAIHNFGHNWDVGLKWRFNGGAPYTPYDVNLSSYKYAWDTHLRPYDDLARVNDGEYRPYHQLDLRVDKTWFFKKWTFGLYIDIQNIYNRKSEVQDVVIPEIDSNGRPMTDPANPDKYLMKTISGSSGGTVLPTFGVNIEF